jgi:hypothetical protein
VCICIWCLADLNECFCLCEEAGIYMYLRKGCSLSSQVDFTVKGAAREQTHNRCSQRATMKRSSLFPSWLLSAIRVIIDYGNTNYYFLSCGSVNSPLSFPPGSGAFSVICINVAPQSSQLYTKATCDEHTKTCSAYI